MLKRSWLRIEPWGTPVITSFHLLKEPLIMLLWNLLQRKRFNKLKAWLEKSHAFSFTNSKLWLIVSKSFERSIKITPPTCKNWTQSLHSFLKYCTWKNTEICMDESFWTITQEKKLFQTLSDKLWLFLAPLTQLCDFYQSLTSSTMWE